MARLVLIIHQHDRLYRWSPKRWKWRPCYLIVDIIEELQRRGHEIHVQKGTRGAPQHADLALLHVNATRVPAEYTALASQYPRCLNLLPTDISKRVISGALLRPDMDWSGPVVVKSDLNCAGTPEVRLNRAARIRLKRAPFPLVRAFGQYRVYPHRDAIPEQTLRDARAVVERFIPEPDPNGFALRFWLFLGDQERCMRYVSGVPILKGHSVRDARAVEVPHRLRELRQELGFDYGKFDFVVHDGEVTLLDANKTPGRPPEMLGSFAEQVRRLTDGFESLIDAQTMAACTKADA
ncbi:hypothetical protein [Thioalkalivibrio sp. ALJ1]|uniref:hypothetical protein n=1 Tax=Thioalkalivibrio sp. ALJ1 TaxID=1158144 RepID=UPI00069164DC|nr:hypothetical protein [Thioalkalivibrio sp. ALJ1]